MRVDAIVLGAGIVGVSTALHLQMRGAAVALVDRGSPGGGASFGNAGLIERSSIIPTAFPRTASGLAKYAFHCVPAVRMDPSYIVGSIPLLVRYWHSSSPSNLKLATEAMRPLIEASVDEHVALIGPAGADDLVSANGWIGIWRSRAKFDAVARGVGRLDRYNLSYTLLGADEISMLEPGIRIDDGGAVGGIHWHDPKTVSDPGELVKRYARLFARRGGLVLEGNAKDLHRSTGMWSLRTRGDHVEASSAVLALGAHSSEVARLFGYRLPLLMKRGYHRHYRTAKTALRHTVADQEMGFVLSPMTLGLRLTTGVEFAGIHARPNPVQLANAESDAARLLTLGDPVEDTPWMGIRPCSPDMLPFIGTASRVPGLWFNFGHGHNGLTIGPPSGRLLAEMMMGERTFADPTPYRPDRF